MLVIDDCQEARDLYGELLDFHGFLFDSAESGAVGLARAFKAPPDLIVLDFSMPGMDGAEVLRRLRADDRTRTIPVVMVSAAPDLVDEEVRAACEAFLEKPCQFDRLTQTIAALLDERRRAETDRARCASTASRVR